MVEFEFELDWIGLDWMWNRLVINLDWIYIELGLKDSGLKLDYI